MAVFEEFGNRRARAELERHVEVSGCLDSVEPLDDVLVALFLQARDLASQELHVEPLAAQFLTPLLTLHLHGHHTPEHTYGFNAFWFRCTRTNSTTILSTVLA